VEVVVGVGCTYLAMKGQRFVEFVAVVGGVVEGLVGW
jgi:hypothetical protein